SPHPHSFIPISPSQEVTRFPDQARPETPGSRPAEDDLAEGLVRGDALVPGGNVVHGEDVVDDGAEGTALEEGNDVAGEGVGEGNVLVEGAVADGGAAYGRAAGEDEPEVQLRTCAADQAEQCDPAAVGQDFEA